jgi:hypothetical protein
MIDVTGSIEEVAAFIKEQEITAPFFVASEPVTASYKKFLAMLLQRHGAHKTALLEEARSFLDEAASDLSYALYLSALGFYKPARLSLRGAVENVLRFALRQQGVDPKPLTVSQMFEVSKAHDAYAPLASAISTLKDTYSKLCRSSHTIDIQFMAHKVPFSELVERNEPKFKANLSDFSKVAGAICSVVYVSCPEGTSKLAPDQQDFVRAEIPKVIKKAILNG